jgi:hypothetical protein
MLFNHIVKEDWVVLEINEVNGKNDVDLLKDWKDNILHFSSFEDAEDFVKDAGCSYPTSYRYINLNE